jgi:hypothetical protein
MAWPPVARSRKSGSYFFSYYVGMKQQYPFQLGRKDSIIMKSVGCHITGRPARGWVANLFRRKFLPNDWQNATGLPRLAAVNHLIGAVVKRPSANTKCP